MNSIPKKIFVFIIANISKICESFLAKICVIVKTIAKNITNISIENTPTADVMTKNHNEIPAVTVIALNFGDENSILYRINESN